MEIYILNASLRRTEVIDDFISLIWTERWAGWGDFELSIRSTPEARSLLVTGTFLGISASNSVMIVETTEDGVSSEGLAVLKASGRSIESIFDHRVIALPGMTDKGVLLFGTPIDKLTNTVRRFAHPQYVNNPNDAIQKLVLGRHPDLPTSSIPLPMENVSKYYEPQTLYNFLVEEANLWAVGFRLRLNDDNGLLYFDVYTGNDRTTSQTKNAAVVFSPELDNLQNTTELNVIEDAKNVAIVVANGQMVEVVAPGVLPDVDDLDRRVTIVKAEGVEDLTGEALTSAMTQQGREALAKQRPLRAMDGEISQNSSYVYLRDYYLGDIVEMRNKDNVSNHMRVTELIFVSDAEGERVYPTLTLNTFVGPGTWTSWPTDKKWIDYDVDIDTVWAILP